MGRTSEAFLTEGERDKTRFQILLTLYLILVFFIEHTPTITTGVKLSGYALLTGAVFLFSRKKFIFVKKERSIKIDPDRVFYLVLSGIILFLYILFNEQISIASYIIVSTYGYSRKPWPSIVFIGYVFTPIAQKLW